MKFRHMTSHHIQNDVASCVTNMYSVYVNMDKMWIIRHLMTWNHRNICVKLWIYSDSIKVC
jgi:hypothetical protein